MPRKSEIIVGKTKEQEAFLFFYLIIEVCSDGDKI